jgi:hypothetical protein
MITFHIAAFILISLVVFLAGIAGGMAFLYLKVFSK